MEGSLNVLCFFVYFHEWFSLKHFWVLMYNHFWFLSTPLNVIYDDIHGLTVNIDGIVSISISDFPRAISGFGFLTIVVAKGVTVIFLLGINLQYYY